jgi:ribosomal protein S12 methylthiotransferase
MNKERKIAAVALGCAKNRIDTEEILGLLGRHGYLITDDPALADAVIINTCAFIEEAQQESIEAILALVKQRRDKVPLIIAAGCLAQHFGERLLQEIPELNGVIGVHSYAEIIPFLESCFAGKRELLLLAPPDRYRDLGPRLLTTAAHSAYVKIAEGCDNRCRYCLIPSLRGPLRSRPTAEIISEVRDLIAGGTREINLIAQDSTAYGADRGLSDGLSLLLQQILQEIPSFFWIRILYAHPARVTAKLISLIAREERICKYLDLPLQHINSTVLRRMGRRYTREEVVALVQKLRRCIPGIVLRTTYLAGFPGESRPQFRELHAFLQEQPFERVGVFAYSKQPGTAAALLPDQVPSRVKQKRRRELLSLQQGIALEFNQRLIGQKFTVLVEGPAGAGEKLYRGRTSFQAPEVDGLLYFRSPRPLRPGSWAQVQVTAASPYDLYGTALK